MTSRTSDKLNPGTLKAEIAKLRAAEATGKFGDGKGLYLIVTNAGRARFLHRFQFRGRTAERMFPGEFPDEISLAEARDIRDADRKLIREGVNPILAAKAASAGCPTFAEYALAHADFLAPKSKRGEWLRQMTGEDTQGVTVGALAALPIDDIKLAHVKAVIAPLWQRQPATAKEVCGRIRRVLDHRQVNARPDDDRVNPADFRRIERAIGKRFVLRHKPRAALDWRMIPDFLVKLAGDPSIKARLLEIVIATGCRVNEITQAQWDEIDWTARDERGRLAPTLTIPATRMKGRADDHVVPLTRVAIRALRRALMRGATPKAGALIFPNRKRKPFDDKCILIVGKTAAGDASITTHGFRSAMVGWGTAIAHRDLPVFERDLMDVCLAHEIGGEVSQAYLRDRWLERRRAVMAEWAAFCSTPTSAKVVPFIRRVA